MGTQARRLKKFLAIHPKCCYCGGGLDATTQDHFPPRSVFPSRQWPEGYVFPACDVCNSSTSEDENIVALFARIYPEAKSAEEQLEVTKIMQAVAERHPDLFRSLFPSSNKVRRWLSARNITLDAGMTTKDVPIMSIDHPRISIAVERFATKLFCSLYYKHTKTILSQSGGVFFRWYSNAQSPEQLPPEDILGPMLKAFPKLTRQGTSLASEFSYRYGIAADTGTSAAFHVVFRQSIGMLGFVFGDISKVKTPERAIVLRPFGH